MYSGCESFLCHSMFGFFSRADNFYNPFFPVKKYPSFEGNYYALDNLPALKKSPPNNNILEQSLKIETAINISRYFLKVLIPFIFIFQGKSHHKKEPFFLHCPDESYYNSL